MAHVVVAVPVAVELAIVDHAAHGMVDVVDGIQVLGDLFKRDYVVGVVLRWQTCWKYWAMCWDAAVT